MVKVLIVDDEKIMRDGLSKIIETSCPAFEVVGGATNGENALAAARRLKPDICLVDMKMPIMEGDEFIRLASREFPSMIFVVLSGHAEFDYARRLIGMGCSAYLLKPVNHDELCALLLSLKSKIEYYKCCYAQNPSLFQAALEPEQYEKERRLYRFLIDGGEHGVSPEESASFCFESGKRYYICVFSIDRAYIPFGNGYKALPIPRKWPEFKLSIRKTLKELHPLSGICFDTDDRSVVVLLSDCAPSPAHPEGMVSQFIKRVRKSFFTDDTDFSFTVGYCGPLSEPSEMPLALIHARDAVSLRFTGGYGRVYNYREALSFSRNIDAQHPSSYKKTLTEALERGESEGFSSAVLRMLSALKDASVSRSQLLPFLCNLYITVLNKLSCRSEPQKLRELLPEYALFEDTVHRLDSYDNLKKYFLDITNKIAEAFENKSSGEYCHGIMTSLQYIDNNYRHDIGLEDISRHVGMNSSYFCQFFKRETGRTFINYLTSYRIDRAKAFLTEGNHAVGEISWMVGYKDAKYFSKIFKKATRQTPSQYREEALKTPQV